MVLYSWFILTNAFLNVVKYILDLRPLSHQIWLSRHILMCHCQKSASNKYGSVTRAFSHHRQKKSWLRDLKPTHKGHFCTRNSDISSNMIQECSTVVLHWKHATVSLA